MALSNSSTFSLFLTLLFITSTFANTNVNVDESEFSIIKSVSKKNVIHLHFYFHEYFGTTAIVVARDSNNPGNSTFGNVPVFDDDIRVGPDASSTLIGKTQGLGAGMMDGSYTVALNFVFNAGPYKNSTLALFGRVDATNYAERTVIGGSGQFRGAKGYAISKLVRNPTPNYIVVEFDIYVKIDTDFLDEE